MTASASAPRSGGPSAGSTRHTAWIVAGAVVVLLIVGLIWRSTGGGSDTAAPAKTVAAESPFRSLTAGTVKVGGQTLRVVIADDELERSQGLRGRSSPAPYDGMLFVFQSDGAVAFTMAGVPDPLDIGFFAADGTRVDQLRMEPCNGTDVTCPVYRSRGDFRYALETAPGGLPSGSLKIR